MERIEIFTAKTLDEAKSMATETFGADELDIQFEIIEQPKKGLLGIGTKGEFRIRAIYTPSPEEVAAVASVPVSEVVEKKEKSVHTKTSELIDSAPFKPVIEYINGIFSGLGIEGYTISVKTDGENNIIDIVGDSLGIIIGRRGETLDALQYLSILANNKVSAENKELRLMVDCNSYREKRAEILESLAIRTSAKVIKNGRRITLEPMNPYERRIIHSKISEIDGVYSGSIGDEPYRKVVISAESAKHGNYSDKRSPRSGGFASKGNANASSGSSVSRAGGGSGEGERGRTYSERDRGASGRNGSERSKSDGPIISGRAYKQSTGFSTSFEREYKRIDAPEISQDTVDVEKSTSLYGKIEL